MANSFEHISIAAVKALATLAARKAVEAELRAKGVRTTSVPRREIELQAYALVAARPELIAQAREQAQRLGMYERRRSAHNSRQK